MAEGLGTALLLAAVVGSGIMGERLSQGNDALTLLANSLATGFALSALIVAFGPRSGAHFNPAVTLARGFTNTFTGIDLMHTGPFIAAQLVGAALALLADRLR